MFMHMSAWIFSGVCVAQSSVFCHTDTVSLCIRNFLSPIRDGPFNLKGGLCFFSNKIF